MFGDLRTRYFVSTLSPQPPIDLRDYIEPGRLILHHRRVRFPRIKIHRMAMSRRSLGEIVSTSRSHEATKARARLVVNIVQFCSVILLVFSHPVGFVVHFDFCEGFVGFTAHFCRNLFSPFYRISRLETSGTGGP